MFDREVLKVNGWRQGVFVKPEDVPYLLPEFTDYNPESQCYMVISHSCDVLCPAIEKEPVVELILCRIVDVSALDSNCEHVKNSRQLHCHIFKDNLKERGLIIHAHEKICIDRNSLMDVTPDSSLSVTEATRENVAHWLSNRYQRSALPDGFNSILATQKQLKKALKKLNDTAKEIRLALYPDRDLDKDEQYDVSFYIILPVGYSSDDDAVHGKLVALKKALDESPFTGQINAESIDKIPYQIVETTKKLDDLEYLSLKDPAVPPSPSP